MPARLVELTWIGNDKKEFVEEVWLLDDDDRIMALGEPVDLLLNGQRIRTIGEISKEHVFFEDESGIFMLQPKKIVNIRPL